MIVQCCVCGKIRHDARWMIPTRHQLKDQQISHIYCPACAHKTISEYRKNHSTLLPHLTPKATPQSA
ncbi:MAG TPA: hypothetical protein PLA12_04250 [Candidatus Hydrogenedens sp.]|nr:hypothetical protein [Candidatus Hydrogenedens sp.]